MTHWSGSTLVIIFHPSTWGIWKRFINVLTQRSLFPQNTQMLQYSVSTHFLLPDPERIPIRCLWAWYSGMMHRVQKQIRTIIRQMFDAMHHVTQPVAHCHCSKGFWHDTLCQCCSTKPACSKNRDKFTSDKSRSNCSDFTRFASAYVKSEFGS